MGQMVAWVWIDCGRWVWIMEIGGFLDGDWWVSGCESMLCVWIGVVGLDWCCCGQCYRLREK